MGLWENWSDSLIAEGLREAADTLFEARTTLEEDIAVFKQQADRLKNQAREIRSWFAGLTCFLGSEAGSRALFEALGVDLKDKRLYSHNVCNLQFKRSRSFTRKGLYTKSVWNVYEALARMIEIYMHGAHYTDREYQGRVFVTANYTQLHKRCAEINTHIAQINEYNRPSESLAFAKRLNQALVDKEDITGGGAQTWRLDHDLAFKPLIFADYALPVFPELPVDDAARDTLDTCCSKIFNQERSHVDSLLEEIFNPAHKTVCVLERDP